MANDKCQMPNLRFGIRHWAFAVLLLGMSAAAADAQTVTLRYGWTKGESRSYRMTTQTDSVITGLPNTPGPLTTAQTMTQVLKFVAEDVAPDGTTTLRQTFQSIRMETTNPMGKFVVDTARSDTSQDPMAQSTREVMAAMVGESVLIEIAPDGVVRSVDGASRIADKITRMMAADPATAAAGQGLRTTLGDEALKTTFQQSFPRLSLPPIKVGDTWPGQLAMGNPTIGRITGRSTFTLKAIEGTAEAPLARISVGLALKQDVVPPPSGPAGMVMTLGDAKGAGEILFSVTGGRIQRSTMRTDMPSTIVMTGPDGSPATAENKTTITMTMELVEK
jgi:hypothetical protein